MTSNASRFHIVHQPSSPRRKRLIAALAAVAWLFSLLLIWWIATSNAVPALKRTEARLRNAERRYSDQEKQLKDLNQQMVTLTRSDEISRAANRGLQSSLAEREEEIASLRADIAFYERLVGATGQRKGLNVHSIEFTAEEGGTWQYKAVLTQNLDRSAVSQGQLRFSVEGVQGGKLASASWDELHQKTSVPGQEYSFRYFQEITGSVILPGSFTPQRVKVALRGEGVAINQTFEWKLASLGEGGK
jgi:uncharacterized coiled-coil protein SlyX